MFYGMSGAMIIMTVFVGPLSVREDKGILIGINKKSSFNQLPVTIKTLNLDAASQSESIE